MKHKCKEIDYCTCYSLALEPNEDCHIHGYPWPPRCGECGRFLKRDVPQLAEGADLKSVQCEFDSHGPDHR